MRAPFALLAAVALAAGCVSGTDPDSPDAAPSGADAAVAEALRALMAGVPCEADVGEGTSANLLKLGALDIGFPVSEMDIRGHIALVIMESPRGIVVVDLSDPRDMRVVSSIEIDEGTGTDVKWTPSGDGAYFGTTGSLTLVDLTVLEEPRIASTLDLPAQAHSLSAREIGGEEWVYASGQWHDHGTFVVKRDGWELALVAEYGTVPLAGVLASGPIGHHDALVVNDSLLDDRPLLYVSQGFEGWSVADLEDPAQPRKIGGSLPEGAGYTHMVRVAVMDGKRIVASMQEAGDSALHVYDATDLAAPKLLARWKADATRPLIPQHNLQIAGDHLFMAHYTEGFFVFNLTRIVAEGALMPNLQVEPVARYAVETPDEPGPLGFADVLDLQVDDGVIVTTEMENGLAAFGFGCMAPGDPTQASRL